MPPRLFSPESTPHVGLRHVSAAGSQSPGGKDVCREPSSHLLRPVHSLAAVGQPLTSSDTITTTALTTTTTHS